MSVTQPSTIWISGRCYRVNSSVPSNFCFNTAEDDLYGDMELYQDEPHCDGPEATEFVIEQLQNGRYRSSLTVASIYYPHLIGSKGKKKQAIESTTHTKIMIPGKGQPGDVVIIGNDIQTVRQARLKLDQLIDQVRRKQPFTHFISLPLNKSTVKENFCKFKAAVMSECGNSRGIDESIFQNSERLHLTFCVLVLADDRERQHAVDAMNEYRPVILSQYIGDEPMCIEVKGIDYMNDNPAEVKVLFGCVSTVTWNYSLQDLADGFVTHMVKAGLMQHQYDKVKLHVTLMNTKFRNEDDGVEDDNRSDETFDARAVLQKFQNFNFGELEVDEIHLSVRHTRTDNDYYKASAKLMIRPL